MPRVTRDDLEYCVEFNWCLDCYGEEKDVQAVRLQRRRKLQVPFCGRHLCAHRWKISQDNALKYARRSERKQRAQLCVYHGCHAKLIPQEILPPWIRRESTCGQHATFKAFQINRIAVIRYIMDSMTPEERRTAIVQNVIYEPGEEWVFIGIQYPNRYETHVGSASGLERRIREIRSHKVSHPTQP